MQLKMKQKQLKIVDKHEHTSKVNQQFIFKRFLAAEI